MSYQQTQYFYPPRQIYLNSKFASLLADTRKKNHAWFSLNHPISIPHGYNNVLVSVDDAQIPVSFYNINETNNRVRVAVGSTASNYNENDDIFTIPIGNYDAYGLSLTLKALVNDEFGSVTNYGSF